MTFGFSSATSGLSPASAQGSAFQRTDRGSAGTPAASFAQMLHQHQSTAPETPKPPEQQPAPRTPDRGAARLAERPATARQTDATQQANRDAAAQAEKSARLRKANHDDSGKGPSDSVTVTGSRTSNPSSDAGKADNADPGRVRRSASSDKPCASKGQTDSTSGDEAEVKAGAASADPADASPTAALPAIAPTAVPDAASAASNVAAATQGRPTAATRLAADALVDGGGAVMDGAGLPASPGLANIADRSSGHKLPADMTAAGKLLQAAKDDVATKAGDALPANAAKTGSGSALDTNLVAAMHVVASEQKQGDSARNVGDTLSAPRVEGINGGAPDLAGLMSPNAAAAARTQAPDAPAPTTTQVMFATPTTSLDFTQALGLQVSALAADGVQTAQLHLNPVETGPISIQITLDGTQAQVDFQAANAGTRDAISAGMPELAAALHEAGLTLAGGGVSEHGREGHAAQDSQGRTAFGRRGGADSDLPTSAPAPIVSRQPRSAVDLYA